jgi:hypothetical protein
MSPLVPLTILAAAAIVAGSVWWSRRAEKARPTLAALIDAEATAHAAWRAAVHARDFGEYESHGVQSMRHADAQYKYERYLAAKAAVDKARTGGAA